MHGVIRSCGFLDSYFFVRGRGSVWRVASLRTPLACRATTNNSDQGRSRVRRDRQASPCQSPAAILQHTSRAPVTPASLARYSLTPCSHRTHDNAIRARSRTHSLSRPILASGRSAHVRAGHAGSADEEPRRCGTPAAARRISKGKRKAVLVGTRAASFLFARPSALAPLPRAAPSSHGEAVELHARHLQRDRLERDL